MARKTKQQARETRQLILDVALRLFSQQGVSSTSLATIAKACMGPPHIAIFTL
ncbi:TetR family transcriptional regulator, partial [Klebsiella pneumoniae]|uniref:TetR family transcriptional regulator n=1 Tax=Klebsiella pneumoniae TaxID=573 RepID=UPI0013D485EE